MNTSIILAKTPIITYPDGTSAEITCSQVVIDGSGGVQATLLKTVYDSNGDIASQTAIPPLSVRNTPEERNEIGSLIKAASFDFTALWSQYGGQINSLVTQAATSRLMHNLNRQQTALLLAEGDIATAYSTGFAKDGLEQQLLNLKAEVAQYGPANVVGRKVNGDVWLGIGSLPFRNAAPDPVQ